jgi:hypothetical protein
MIVAAGKRDGRFCHPDSVSNMTNAQHDGGKAWSGRFSEPVSDGNYILDTLT